MVSDLPIRNLILYMGYDVFLLFSLSQSPGLDCERSDNGDNGKIRNNRNPNVSTPSTGLSVRNNLDFFRIYYRPHCHGMPFLPAADLSEPFPPVSDKKGDFPAHTLAYDRQSKCVYLLVFPCFIFRLSAPVLL